MQLPSTTKHTFRTSFTRQTSSRAHPQGRPLGTLPLVSAAVENSPLGFPEIRLDKLLAYAYTVDGTLCAEGKASGGLGFEGIGLIGALGAEIVAHFPRSPRIVAAVHPRNLEASAAQLRHLAMRCNGSLHLIKLRPPEYSSREYAAQ